MTNTKKSPAQTAPDLLLARFTPNPSAFEGMSVATLKMPYDAALGRFARWLGEYFKRNNVRDNYGETLVPNLPYRLLNSALVACAPTLAHGFEKYSVDKTDYGRRMLVVAKPNMPLVYPDTAQIQGVMQQWVRAWHEGEASHWLRNAIAVEGKTEWETLLNALNDAPETEWRTNYDLQEILTHTRQEGGFAFDLLPNLLATLLHDTESVIQGTTIHWRKMQEGGKHLYLLSQPLPVHIAKTKPQKNADGTYTQKTFAYDTFFCYKIEICLHDQAGLSTPWVYIKPHCTRLAFLPMTYNKRGSELTILVGTNESRLTNWPADTTLVRLKASKSPKEAVWLDDLPNLLERIGARPLQQPKEICSNPLAFWLKDKGRMQKDEYYALHTEGYEYKGAKTHPVLAGLPLPEQAEIIGAITGGFLQQALVPDTAIAPDPFCFAPKEEPVILRDIEEIRKFHGVMTDAECRHAGITREQARQQRNDYWRPHLLQAITRATRGKRLLIACFYSSPQTLDWVKRGLWRNSLLLPDGGSEPIEVTLLPIPIPPEQTDLVKPCPKNAEGKAQKSPATIAWREDLLLRWQEYLRTVLGDYQQDNSVLVSAIVELDASHGDSSSGKGKILARESAHSVIREAFARQNIRVQMTLPIRKGSGHAQFDAGQTGKSLNVVQEVISRQLGAVFAPPAELYRGIGLDGFGNLVSEHLDVVAFSFRSSQGGLRYCLATRLRADGTVDVMLPGASCVSYWIPYADAYTQLGSLFAGAKKYVQRGELCEKRFDRDTPCPLRLAPVEAAGFIEAVLTTCLDKPTVAIIEAERWRQSYAGHGGWWQLGNPSLARNQDVLLFPDGKATKKHSRDAVDHLLAVIRLRTGDETPGYVTNRSDWQFDGALSMPNYAGITGFRDDRPAMFHYLSINKVGTTNKKQPQHGGIKKPVRYKIAGSEHTFKHAPVIEMVPFFVEPRFDTVEGRQALCRVPHYLRLHPGWGMGEINSPYPLHLGDELIKDQETILALD